jgi:hypothetical protein
MAYTRAVRFLTITPVGPADPCGLEPAPNVTDWAEITEGLKGAPEIESIDTLRDGTHDIRGSYRGWSIYLYPNVRFTRTNPKTSGGNGLAGWPPVGSEEEVLLRVNGENYAALVEFV